MFITMNFAVEIPYITQNNILMLDLTPNIVINGSFTKINYITDFLTINGLYIMFPINPLETFGARTKMQMKYNPYTPANAALLHDVMQLEHRLLDMYIHMRGLPIKKQISLSKQLQAGYMKIYKEMTAGVILPPPAGFGKRSYMIKISGIWESGNECGITYKLFESFGYSG
jgi:hypothetical protein